MWVGGWVGKVSKEKKIEIKGKKRLGRGLWENKVKKKLRLGLRNAKETKVNLGCDRDRK